jgi:hypothetical protein
MIGNGEELTLTGESSAQLRNNVNCQVNTTDSLNTFSGREVTYSAGSGNFYVDAIIGRDESQLCITMALSDSSIALEGRRREAFEEGNYLLFEEVSPDVIKASGGLGISRCMGSIDGVISSWVIEEEVVIPPLHQTAVDGFKFEADGIGPIVELCSIEITADVENLELPTSEVSGGLTISGQLTIKATP